MEMLQQWDAADLGQKFSIWDGADLDQRSLIWDACNSEERLLIWKVATSDERLLIWDAATSDQKLLIWDAATSEERLLIWEMANLEERLLIWEAASSVEKLLIWDVATSLEERLLMWEAASSEERLLIWDVLRDDELITFHCRDLLEKVTRFFANGELERGRTLIVVCAINRHKSGLVSSLVEQYNVLKRAQATEPTDEPKQIKTGKHDLTFAKAEELYSQKHFQDALDVINDVHDSHCDSRLVLLQASCYKSLEKYDDVRNTFYMYIHSGHRMTVEMHKIMGEILRTTGHSAAIGYYKKLRGSGDCTQTEEVVYSELIKGLHREMEEATKRKNAEKKRMKKNKKDEEMMQKKEHKLKIANQLQIPTKKDSENVDNDNPQEDLEVPINMNFQMTRSRSELFYGRRYYDVNEYHMDDTRAFFKATPSQVHNIAELIEISTNTIYVVSVEHLIPAAGGLYMVGESVVDVDLFFKREFDRFQNVVNQSESQWWSQICEKFRNIFRRVIYGLIYLDSLGYIAGDLDNRIYVDKKDFGKILPLMYKKDEKMGDEANDVQNLIKKMKNIITLPFPDSEVDESFELPYDLNHLLTFVDSDKLEHVPLSWLIHHPYVWTIEEKVSIVKDIASLTKLTFIRTENFELSMTRWREDGFNWRSNVPENLENGLFTELLKGPKHCDIHYYCSYSGRAMVRYMNACYSRINDDFYSRKFWPKERKTAYLKKEIEAFLAGIFPKAYVSLYEAIYVYVSNLSKVPEVEEVKEQLFDAPGEQINVEEVTQQLFDAPREQISVAEVKKQLLPPFHNVGRPSIMHRN